MLIKLQLFEQKRIYERKKKIYEILLIKYYKYFLSFKESCGAK